MWNDDGSEEMKSDNGNKREVVESSKWESMSMVEEKDARTKKSSKDLNEFSLGMDDKNENHESEQDESSNSETMLLDMKETGVCVEKVSVETDACGKYIYK